MASPATALPLREIVSQTTVQLSSCANGGTGKIALVIALFIY
jgi:hypothetical protein